MPPNLTTGRSWKWNNLTTTGGATQQNFRVEKPAPVVSLPAVTRIWDSPGGEVPAEIWPVGIETAEVIGQPTLGANLTSVGTIAGAEAFGIPVVSTGVFLTDAGGLASSEAFGSPGLSARIAAGAIATAEVIGSPSVTAKIDAGAIVSGEALGAPILSARVSPAAIVSGEVIGQPSLTANLTSTGTIAGAEAFGEPTVTPVISLTDAGDITSSEAFGSPSLSALLVPVGIAGGELFGTADVSVWYLISPDGIPGGEEFGEPTVTIPYPVMPYGIWSEEAFGTPTVAIQWAISGTVKDKQGNPVVGADVNLFNTDTRVLVHNGISDSLGRYRAIVENGTTNHFLVAFYGTSPRKAGVTLDNLKGK